MYQSSVFNSDINIKPTVSKDDCRRMFFRLYGLQSCYFEELNGYDDKNFKITVDLSTNGNQHIKNISATGYVLKILNSLDSRKEDFIEGQNSLLKYLANNGVKCPKPVKNINGNYYSMEKLSSGNHIVRLMEFMPGRVLLGISYNPELFYEIGKNIATINLLLKDFHHPSYSTHKSLWMLDSVPELHHFLFAIKDKQHKSMITNTILRFKIEILGKLHQFERGMIHGDCNEQNVLVEERSDGSFHYSGLLDFGDTSYGCYLFELAITMLYMMLLENDVKAGCEVLMGYNYVRKVTELEVKSLLLCIQARLCQSLVLGAYTSQRDPENSSYLLTTAKKGWDLLTYLCNDNGTLTKIWMQNLKQ